MSLISNDIISQNFVIVKHFGHEFSMSFTLHPIYGEYIYGDLGVFQLGDEVGSTQRPGHQENADDYRTDVVRQRDEGFGSLHVPLGRVGGDRHVQAGLYEDKDSRGGGNLGGNGRR